MVWFKTILCHFVTPRLSIVISSTRFDKAPFVSAHKYSLKILTDAVLRLFDIVHTNIHLRY